MSYHRMLFVLTVVLLVATPAAQAEAALIAEDNFDSGYSAGALAGQSPATLGFSVTDAWTENDTITTPVLRQTLWDNNRVLVRSTSNANTLFYANRLADPLSLPTPGAEAYFAFTLTTTDDVPVESFAAITWGNKDNMGAGIDAGGNLALFVENEPAAGGGKYDSCYA